MFQNKNIRLHHRKILCSILWCGWYGCRGLTIVAEVLRTIYRCYILRCCRFVVGALVLFIILGMTRGGFNDKRNNFTYLFFPMTMLMLYVITGYLLFIFVSLLGILYGLISMFRINNWNNIIFNIISLGILFKG